MGLIMKLKRYFLCYFFLYIFILIILLFELYYIFEFNKFIIGKKYLIIDGFCGEIFFKSRFVYRYFFFCTLY